MRRFGHYVTVHELRRTGLTAVFSGRDDKSPDDKFAIKVLEPSVLFADKEHEKAGANQFLNSARLQQKVVARGSQHWAPIYEYGLSPDGTFYVTNKYEHSLEKLIDLHAELAAKDLHAIIKQIAEGLIELKKAYKRPHGNLEATNVFITGDSSEMKVALSDPLPDESIDAKVHWYADLRAIGELIYQLVVHRPAPSLAGARISDSKEWAGLKRQNDAWRDLCERLLAIHIRPDAITLEGLVEKLTELEKSKPVFSGRRIALSLLTIIAIVIVYLALRSPPVPPEAREYFLQDYFSWVRPLYHNLGFDYDKKTCIDSIENGLANDWIVMDPNLGEIIIGEKLDCEDSKIWNAGLREKTTTKDDDIIKEVRDLNTDLWNAIKAVEYLRKFFDPNTTGEGRWPILVEIHEAAESMKNEEKWLQPAASYFDYLVDKVRPPNKELFEGDANNVSPKKEEIYEGVNEILELKKNIRDIRREIENLRKEVSQYANGKRTKVDEEWIGVADEYSDIKTSEKFDRYLDEIRGFKNIESLHGKYKEKWDTDYTLTSSLVENFKYMLKNIENAVNFENKLKELKTNFDQFKQNLEEKGIYYIAKNEDIIREKYKELMDDLQNLWGEIVKDLNDPSEWLINVKARAISNSAVLENKWKNRQNELLDDDTCKKLESDDRERYRTYIDVQPKVEYSWNRLNELQILGTNLFRNFEGQLRSFDEQVIHIDDLTKGYREALEDAFGEIEYNELLDNNSAHPMPDINELADFEYFSGHKLVQLNLVKGSSATNLIDLVSAYSGIREQFRLFYLLDDKKTEEYVEMFEERFNKLKDDEVFSEIFDSDSKVNEAFSILESKISKIRNITKMQLSELRSQVDKVLVEMDNEARDADYAVLYAVYVELEKSSGDLKWPKDPNEWNLEQTINKLLHERIGMIRDKGDRAEELKKELDGIFAKRQELFEKLKPKYCKLLDLDRQTGQNILVFAKGIALRDKFKPVMDANGNHAVVSAWDEIRQAVKDKDKKERWIDFFNTTDPSDKINVGWPKYIRSEIDPNVILRFIPAGNGNPEPFYMAIHEITNRQYAAVVPYRAGLIYPAATYEVENRKIRLEWAGSTFSVVDPKWSDYPVTWVYYEGAKEYAGKLGAQLPTAKQHEYVCRTAPSDPQHTERPHLRGPAWQQARIAYNKLAKSNRESRPFEQKREAPLPLGIVKPDDFKDEYFDDVNDVGHIVTWNYNSAWPINVVDDGQRANGWGLYDLIGNVWEWCTENDKPVLCGGSCLAELKSEPLFSFDTLRFYRKPTECDVGFRIVVPVKESNANSHVSPQDP